jgi:hypothetical protein
MPVGLRGVPEGVAAPPTRALELPKPAGLVDTLKPGSLRDETGMDEVRSNMANGSTTVIFLLRSRPYVR